MSVGKANLLAVPIFLVLAGAYLLAFTFLWDGLPVRSFFTGRATLIALVTGIGLHEVLHGLGWKLAGRVSWSDIRFGVHWKLLTPYAHCRAPISVQAYRLGTLLPAVVTGFIPATIGLVIGDAWITMLGALFLGAAGGDLLALWVLRSVPSDTRVLDHPSRLGCRILPDQPSPVS